MRVVAEPAIDANHAVAAVALWVDTPSTEPDTAPRLAPVLWDRVTLTAQPTPAAHLLRADSISGFQSHCPISNLLRNTHQFADATRFLDFCFAESNRRRFQGEIDVRHDSTNELMKWQIAARSDGEHVSILLHEITQFEPVSVGTQGLRSLPTNHSSSAGAALVCLPNGHDPQIVYWLTPVPSQLADSSARIHPRDAHLVREAQTKLAHGASRQRVQIRVQSGDHWTICNVVCSPYPTENSRVPVVVCEFAVDDFASLDTHRTVSPSLADTARTQS